MNLLMIDSGFKEEVMAHCNIEEEDVKRDRLLEELYRLNDEYNNFVQHMDKKLDVVISKMEGLSNEVN